MVVSVAGTNLSKQVATQHSNTLEQAIQDPGALRGRSLTNHLDDIQALREANASRHTAPAQSTPRSESVSVTAAAGYESSRAVGSAATRQAFVADNHRHEPVPMMQAMTESKGTKFRYAEGSNCTVGPGPATDLLFPSGSATLTERFKSELADQIANAKHYPDRTISITGFTDNIGSAEFNQRLSEQRATAVANYFRSQGVTSPIRIVGRGEMDPIVEASSDRPTAANSRAQAPNRRIEIESDWKDPSQVIKPTGFVGWLTGLFGSKK